MSRSTFLVLSYFYAMPNFCIRCKIKKKLQHVHVTKKKIDVVVFGCGTLTKVMIPLGDDKKNDPENKIPFIKL